MPYTIQRNEDGEYCVYRDVEGEATGTALGCHATQAAAAAQIGAIEADETKALIQSRKLVDYTQEEVGYMTVAAAGMPTCSSCRWYQDNYCHIVQNYPDAIEPTGVCVKHEAVTDDVPVVQEAPTMDVVTEIDVTKEVVTPKPKSKPGIIQRVLNAFRKPDTSPTMFKAIGDYWFSAWTNNFEDLEGEYFSSRAIDSYIKRVDARLVPMPDLWLWHTPGTRCGQAKMVDRIGAFAVALGTFDDTPQGRAAKTFFNREERFGVSHGFVYRDEHKRDNVYHHFNTFEISPLPREVAANPYCTFEEVKEMEMDEKKKAWLRKVLGEYADTVENELEAKSAALEEVVSYKAYEDDVELEERAEETPEVEEAVAGFEQNAQALISEIVSDLATVVSTLNDNMKRMREYEEKRKQQDESLKSLRDEIAAMKDTLNARPRMASIAPETQLDAKDVSEVASVGVEPTDNFYGPGVGRRTRR